jgi:hypothetical protein
MGEAETPLPDRASEEGRPGRLLALHQSAAELAARNRQIYLAMLDRSNHLREGNFTAVAVADLRLLFELYDAAFFDGLLGAMLVEDSANLTFRLSSRMTRVGGTTVMQRERAWTSAGPPGRVRYEVTVSSVLLFESFRAPDRNVTVGGLECLDRLEALQRIFEHELLHLAEFLAWGRSSCALDNFHRLSQRVFGHAGTKHDLVTPRETAARTYNVQVGDRVCFNHDGVRRTGVVNRITRRATVLVEDPNGRVFSDGKRYATFYLPFGMLGKEPGPI